MSIQAHNASRDTVLAKHIEWAGTSSARKRGLLGRSSLASDEGIYLVPCKWIHMFGMKFPIDVAFLGSKGQVLAVHHCLPPNRLSRLVFRAEGVLELCADTLAATGTKVGDRIVFLRG